MSESESERSLREQQVDALIAEYYQSVERGEPLDQAGFLAAHPDFADELREFLADIGQLADLVRPAAPDLAETYIQPPSEAPPLAPKTVIRYFGEYKLIKQVGMGGMGVVYKARQSKLRRTVALKLIKSGALANPHDLQRFQVEARAAARLSHPGIVPVYEVGVFENQHFYTMEYVAGGSLSRLYRDKPVVARRASKLVQKLAEAMHYAHQNGIVHRDLKPANVLLTAKGQPRITDFGLAKVTQSEDETHDATLTETGQILGTVGYMSPEQAGGKTRLVGPSTDIYALGAVLYTLLTGRAPFVGATLPLTLLQVLHKEPVSPRLLNPSLPIDLETICLKCLEKEPHKRYGTAQLLAEDLGRFLAGKPVLARPIGLIERAWRWSRRNLVVAGLLVTVAASLLMGASVSTYHWDQSEKKDEEMKVLEAKIIVLDGKIIDLQRDIAIDGDLVEFWKNYAVESAALAQATQQRLDKLQLESDKVKMSEPAVAGVPVAPPEHNQLANDNVTKLGLPDHIPVDPHAPPNEGEPLVPIAAAAAVPPAVDYSLVHVAPTDVAVLVIRPAQILENPRISEHLKQMELLGGTHPLKTYHDVWIQIYEHYLEMPLPPIESLQISVTRECLDSLATRIGGGSITFPTILVEFGQNVDHEALLMKLLEKTPAAAKDKGSVKQHGNTKLLVSTVIEGDVSYAACFLDAKTMLFGTESAVVRAIDRHGIPEASPLQDRMAPHLGKEVAFMTSDMGVGFRNEAKFLSPVGDHLYYPLATSELFLDLNGEVVYHDSLHNEEDREIIYGNIAFAYVISQLAGAELGQIQQEIPRRQGNGLVPQLDLAPGYTVDKAAFEAEWARIIKKMPEWIHRQQIDAPPAPPGKEPPLPPAKKAALLAKANSLNEIVRAMRRYELRHQCFPAIDSAGLYKSPRGLSWRVHLLPELGLNELHAKFHLDEPWDSDHNKTLIAKMPPIYGNAPAGQSAVHVFIGEGTLFGRKRPIELGQIKDKLDYTAALVEAGPDKAEPWTKPGGIPWNPENPLVELGTIGFEVPVAFFDAGAGWFPKAILQETLSKMIGHTDGDPPQNDILNWRHVPPNRSDVFQ